MPGQAIVQSGRTVLLEVAHPEFECGRAELARFAELEKSPEHCHTYRISAVSLWSAAAAGLRAEEIAQTLVALSRYEVPQACSPTCATCARGTDVCDWWRARPDCCD